jgi:uncharacterized protein YndB with AHSA1/START domain
MSETANQIRKQVVLKASRERVWAAISDSKQFGTWFGVEFEGPFVAGSTVLGRIVPTRVDAKVAKAQAPHAGKPFECRVHSIEPMHRFSFFWHPYDADPGADPAQEPMTEVVFELAEVALGVELTITESGFDKIPLERRASAFSSNEEGWAAQAMLIEKYLLLQQGG